MNLKRLLYIQYTNPAGYPPLEHSSRILGDAGWRVTFLGTGALGADALRFPSHPNITVHSIGYCSPGWRQKLHYFYFCIWVICWTIMWRTNWIYASDPMVCPAALTLCWLPWVSVLYHEHDSPEGVPVGLFQRFVRWSRQQVARRAACCVLPNEARAERFKGETRTHREVLCVWNCPSALEVVAKREPLNGSFWLLYHGSIVPHRLPVSVIDALATLPEHVKLRVIGYETTGSVGYLDRLRERARQLGVASRLDLIGVVPRRFDLMDWCRRCDAGLAFMPMNTSDFNHQAMTGASNKPFDYLACGLALVVSDLPDWRAAYVDPGYAVACDPQDSESIARSVRRFLDFPELAREMGEKGRQRIMADWNYRSRFLPVYTRLHA